MGNSKKKIVKQLKGMNEALKPEDLEVRIGDLVDTTKDTLNVDEPEAKEFVAGMVGEGEGAVSRGIEHGMNPEVQSDEYEEYRQLMQQVAAEEDGAIEEGGESTNNPVKLKNDVKRVLAKLDMSSIQPYLAKIDNPTEQAEMIGQFAEMIGVPRNKLSAVIAQLKILSKGDSNVRESTVSKKKVIRTIKVKDIK